MSNRVGDNSHSIFVAFSEKLNFNPIWPFCVCRAYFLFSSYICLESRMQKSIKCTKVKPPCQLRIIKYMQCTWTAKEEKERENSSRFLCSYLQYLKKKKNGTKLEIILKRLKKSIHSFWHQDCQNTCLLRAYPIGGTYVILWHIM